LNIETPEASGIYLYQITGFTYGTINETGLSVEYANTKRIADLTGESGIDGLTPYVGENDNWWIGDTDTGISVTGPQGAAGQNGAAGLTPYIGQNGNWWIGEVDQGIPVTAEGIEGQIGLSSYELALQEGFEGTLTEWLESLQGQNGVNGLTPYIGQNGNWWIGDTDTEISAIGPQGTAGQNGADGLTPYVGENNNWWIGDTDTGVSITGTRNVSLTFIDGSSILSTFSIPQDTTIVNNLSVNAFVPVPFMFNTSNNLYLEKPLFIFNPVTGLNSERDVINISGKGIDSSTLPVGTAIKIYSGIGQKLSVASMTVKSITGSYLTLSSPLTGSSLNKTWLYVFLTGSNSVSYSDNEVYCDGFTIDGYTNLINFISFTFTDDVILRPHYVKGPNGISVDDPLSDSSNPEVGVEYNTGKTWIDGSPIYGQYFTGEIEVTGMYGSATLIENVDMPLECYGRWDYRVAALSNAVLLSGAISYNYTTTVSGQAQGVYALILPNIDLLNGTIQRDLILEYAVGNDLNGMISTAEYSLYVEYTRL
jgi:uncharacterized protein YneR